MEAATLVEWLVRPGDKVKSGGIIAVVETQKGAIEIEVFHDGTITEITVPVGQRVPVGTILARIDDGKPTLPSIEREIPSSVAETAESARKRLLRVSHHRRSSRRSERASRSPRSRAGAPKFSASICAT